jgi:hypothetical protein
MIVSLRQRNRGKTPPPVLRETRRIEGREGAGRIHERPAQGLIRLLYEEKANGNKQICEPLERLAELDEQMGAEEEITLHETPDGWAIFSDAA